MRTLVAVLTLGISELLRRRSKQREWERFRDSRKPEPAREMREVRPGVFTDGEELVIVPGSEPRED
jgi:hypothetical protein